MFADQYETLVSVTQAKHLLFTPQAVSKEFQISYKSVLGDETRCLSNSSLLRRFVEFAESCYSDVPTNVHLTHHNFERCNHISSG